MLFEGKGEQNTEDALKVAVSKAAELGINHLVLASNTGATVEKLLKIIGKEEKVSLNIVGVTHHVGFKEPGNDEMGVEVRKRLEEAGVKLLTTTHLLAGVDRALRYKFQGVYPAEIIASSLRIMGQGLKVCVEISSMALDAGLVPYGEEIIAVAGSGRGADTAVVIVPAHSNYFFDSQVKEVLCTPRDKK